MAGSVREMSMIPVRRAGPRLLFFIAVAVGAGPALAAGPTASLTIRVENVLAAGGILRLGLYDQASYPNDASTPTASADVPAMAGETVVRLHDIPPGVYAIQAYQDVNANDRMD